MYVKEYRETHAVNCSGIFVIKFKYICMNWFKIKTAAVIAGCLY